MYISEQIILEAVSNWTGGNEIKDNSIIEKVETKLGFKLPRSYKALVNQYNGGRPIKNCFDVGKRKGHVFRSLIPIERITGMKGRVPGNNVPFAEDPFGNYICFNSNGNNISISYYNHEEVEDSKAITIISGSFGGFINKLYKC